MNRIIAFYYTIFLSGCIVSNRTVYSLSKKKMPYLHLIDEAIELIDNEIRIVELSIKYPEQFKRQLDKPPLSPLYLADKTTLINIMEIVSGLFISKISFIKTANLPTWWIWEKPLNGSLISR